MLLILAEGGSFSWTSLIAIVAAAAVYQNGTRSLEGGADGGRRVDADNYEGTRGNVNGSAWPIAEDDIG